MKLLILLTFVSASLFGQSGMPITVPPPPAPVVSVTAVGNNDFSTSYFYMVLVNYPGGQVQSQVVTIKGNSVLSGSNLNQIGWKILPGALTYDVLSLPASGFTGTCTCSIAVGIGGTVNGFGDTGGAKSSYTASFPIPSATWSIYGNNRDYNPAQLRQTMNGTDAPVFWGTPIGNFVPPSTVTTYAHGYLNGTGVTDLVCNPLGSGVRMQVFPTWFATGSSGTTTWAMQFKSGSTYYNDVIAAASLTGGSTSIGVTTNAPLILDAGECVSTNVTGFGTQLYWETSVLTYPVSTNGPKQIKVLGYANTNAIVVFTATGSGAYVLPSALTFSEGVSNQGSMHQFTDASSSQSFNLYIVPPGGVADSTNITLLTLGGTSGGSHLVPQLPLFIPAGYSVQIKYTAPSSSTTAWLAVALVGLP